ncbi:xanthine dehydrogenase [Deltaproteobacteria bacterium Smac51]|nr:xanthine dehydrogenase [Deltaproteobacteria bacterium Smac51]
MQRNILKHINAELSEGRPAVLVTVLNTTGSTPRKGGSQMLVRQSGNITGTIGGGSAEAKAIAEAGKAFQTASSAVHHFSMTNSVAAKDGMACGGDMDVFIHYIPSPNEDVGSEL